jgi:hypothetical protein
MPEEYRLFPAIWEFSTKGHYWLTDEVAAECNRLSEQLGSK